MEKITLYPQWNEIHFNYWEISKEWWIIIEKTRQEIDFLANWDLQKVMSKLSNWYEENKPEEVKYTLISCSTEISSIIQKYE